MNGKETTMHDEIKGRRHVFQKQPSLGKSGQKVELHSLGAGPLELILNLNTGSVTFDTVDTSFDLSEPQFLPTFVRWG